MLTDSKAFSGFRDPAGNILSVLEDDHDRYED